MGEKKMMKVILGSVLLTLSACSTTPPSSDGKRDRDREAAGAGGGKGDDTAAMTGECYGINACQGKGDCGGKSNSCAGKNSCKGKGWIKMSRIDCEEKGGEFKE